MAGVVQLTGPFTGAAAAASGAASLRGVSVRQQQRRGGGAAARRCSSTVQIRAEVTEASSVALNPNIQKESSKVVDTVQVGELSKPITAYCRCWRSGTFPLCDGTHAKFNKATGDNVGPLLLKK